MLKKFESVGTFSILSIGIFWLLLKIIFDNLKAFILLSWKNVNKIFEFILYKNIFLLFLNINPSLFLYFSSGNFNSLKNFSLRKEYNLFSIILLIETISM